MSMRYLVTSQPKLSTITESLTAEELERLDSVSSQISLAPQEYLLHQHTAAQYCYVVKEGELMVERSSSAGRRQVLAFICPGNFIGFTHSDYYEFAAQALSNAILTRVPMAKFKELGNEIPQLKINAEKVSGNIHAHTLDQVFALGQKKAHERVCFFLNQLMERNTNSAQEIKLAMTRQDIADYLGLTIETVSRAFARLKKEQIIDIHSAHIIEILDLDAVIEMADSE